MVPDHEGVSRENCWVMQLQGFAFAVFREGVRMVVEGATARFHGHCKLLSWTMHQIQKEWNGKKPQGCGVDAKLWMPPAKSKPWGTNHLADAAVMTASPLVADLKHLPWDQAHFCWLNCTCRLCPPLLPHPVSADEGYCRPPACINQIQRPDDCTKQPHLTGCVHCCLGFPATDMWI